MIWKKIFEEYEGNPFQDNDTIYKLKEIVKNLPETDRTLLIVYAECQSMKKTAELLKVSSGTIFTHIKTIREHIKKEIDHNDIY